MPAKPKYNYELYINKTINYLQILEVFSKDKKYHFKCKCLPCNRVVQIRATSVISEATKSCGCKREELLSKAQTLENNQMLINKFYKAYKARAKKKSFEFKITIAEFTNYIYGSCFYCKTPPEKREYLWNGRKAVMTIYCHGIDRLNNDLGYIKDNCVTCCKRCNQCKSNLSLNQFKEWIISIYNNCIVDKK